MRRTKILLAVASLTLSSVTLLVRNVGGQETQGYRFATEVQILPVPVFVTDPDGEPVEGLTIDDFIVREQGEIRPIVIFEPMSFERLATWRDSGQPIHPGLRRNFLLLFDLTFSSPNGILRARNAALDFVGEQIGVSSAMGRSSERARPAPVLSDRSAGEPNGEVGEPVRPLTIGLALRIWVTPRTSVTRTLYNA